MGDNYSDSNFRTAFDCQEAACKEFFQEKLPCPKLQPVVLYNKWLAYDITGFDGLQVVAVLSAIVNDRDQFKTNKTLYLLIRDIYGGNTQGGFEELFRFKARPTPHQPGNAIVVLRPRGSKTFKQAKKYDELNGALKAFYYDLYTYGTLILKGTTSFAIHIKELFKNNAVNYHIPQATLEVYMILLFEIARRLVTLDKPTVMKTAYDALPIASAIARVLILLERGVCHFEDVFLPGGRFHCFTGKPEQRRKAIDNINMAIIDITRYEKLTKQPHLEELREVFCFVKPLVMPSSPVEELARQLKNLMKRNIIKFWPDEEYTTAFDHLTLPPKIL